MSDSVKLNDYFGCLIRSTSSKGLFRRPTDDVAALPANGVLCVHSVQPGKVWRGTIVCAHEKAKAG